MRSTLHRCSPGSACITARSFLSREQCHAVSEQWKHEALCACIITRSWPIFRCCRASFTRLSLWWRHSHTGSGNLKGDDGDSVKWVYSQVNASISLPWRRRLLTQTSAATMSLGPSTSCCLVPSYHVWSAFVRRGFFNRAPCSVHRRHASDDCNWRSGRCIICGWRHSDVTTQHSNAIVLVGSTGTCSDVRRAAPPVIYRLSATLVDRQARRQPAIPAVNNATCRLLSRVFSTPPRHDYARLATSTAPERLDIILKCCNCRRSGGVSHLLHVLSPPN